MDNDLDSFAVTCSVHPQCSKRKSLDIATVSNPLRENANFSEDFFKIWHKLPEEIYSDPSVAFVQNHCNSILRNISDADPGIINRFTALSFNNAKSSDMPNNLQRTKLYYFGHSVKLSLLVFCWLVFFVSLLITTGKIDHPQQVIVKNNQINLTLINRISNDRIEITVEGPLLLNKFKNGNKNLPEHYLSVWVELSGSKNSTNDSLHDNIKLLENNLSTVWIIPLSSPNSTSFSSLQKATQVFLLDFLERIPNQYSLELKLKTNVHTPIPFIISYDLFPINTENGIWYGASLLVGLYILIISEVVHKTIGAMLASTTSLAVLAMLNQKPTMLEILSWIDIDTLLLLFSMMMLVAVISQTGIFDYLAVYAYKITKGDVWSLVCVLCLFTAIASAFLDNVTIILLVTPVTIRLCEVIQLNPVPILTAMVIFSNIGGGATPVGDPPNVIIASHHDVVNANIDFGIFTAHMSVGVILVVLAMYGHFRFVFRNLDVLRSNSGPQHVQEIQRKIGLWKEVVESLPNNSADENLVKERMTEKIACLSAELNRNTENTHKTSDNLEITLIDLQKKYPIKKKWLLAKSGFAIVLVLTLFFLHSLPQFNLSLGWTAFMGVLLLLVLADKEDFDNILAKVEWGTLLFFAALFVMMEVLSKLGLIIWVGKQTETVIMSVNEEYRLAVAILLILWISAIAGALFDNVPLITMLIRIVISLSENQDLKLPLQPLIWALAFGACLGGNGTLIGATANVVCAGVAEQHGYRLTFMQFFKMGFPALITSNLVITMYLMVTHVLFDWNY